MRVAILVASALTASLTAFTPAHPPEAAPPPRVNPFEPPAGLPELLGESPAGPNDIPPPRVPGSRLPEPPMMARNSNVRTEAIRGWVGNLGSPEYAFRETAESGLVGSGWDGFTAARSAAGSSECPETRFRASRVCVKYLYFAQPKGGFPKIYNLCCRYNGTTGREPCNQYELALLCHYYTLKAIRIDWESRRSEVRTGEPSWDYSATNYETEATRLMVRDMLTAGFNPEWVRWYLADMSARQNYWPPALKRPPTWLARWVGVQILVPFP